MSLSRPAVSPSCPLCSGGRGLFIFFTSCQAVVWASDTLPVVLFLSPSLRGTLLLFLVYRILMI